MRGAVLALLVLIGAPAAACLLAWAVMVRMPGRSFAGPPPPLSEAEEASRVRLAADVAWLAGRIGERNYTRPAALDAAADYVATTLGGLGYEVEAQHFTVAGHAFRNLEVTVRGRRRPEEIVVVGGHYDSVVGTPGADDNATGVAAVLELARLLRDHPLDRTVRLVAFANEEPPFFQTEHMGSRVYAREAVRRGDRIVAMLSLETIGYYSSERGSQRYPPPLNLAYPDRGDFIGFVGNVRSRALVRRSIGAFRRSTPFPSEGVAAPSWVPGVFWSDHASFWREGIPAVMITDTAPFRNPHYHGRTDTPERIDSVKLTRVVHGVAEVVRALGTLGRD